VSPLVAFIKIEKQFESVRHGNSEQQAITEGDEKEEEEEDDNYEDGVDEEASEVIEGVSELSLRNSNQEMTKESPTTGEIEGFDFDI